MTLIIILGFILIISGVLGCIVPALPGPPLNFLALVLLQIAKDGAAFTTNELVFWGIVTVLVTVIDYVVPIAGAKKYGASKTGVWGSVIGLLVGLIFFPPFGMFTGAFIGALAGEYIVGKKSSDAFKAGWGTFIGTMVGIGLKLAASIAMSYYYIKALF
ncbi:MAG: DUF456 domain-containing protein [candidate division KSB1 bacterium]|nr:DUF456 domain-containing protein [candidate division KSB1 bacterium]